MRIDLCGCLHAEVDIPSLLVAESQNETPYIIRCEWTKVLKHLHKELVGLIGWVATHKFPFDSELDKSEQLFCYWLAIALIKNPYIVWDLRSVQLIATSL